MPKRVEDGLWNCHIPKLMRLGFQSIIIDKLNVTKKVAEWSRLQRDRPLSALVEALFWTEYVYTTTQWSTSHAKSSTSIEFHTTSLYVLAAPILIFYVFVKLLVWMINKLFAFCSAPTRV